jgi:hypothetical protein
MLITIFLLPEKAANSSMQPACCPEQKMPTKRTDDHEAVQKRTVLHHSGIPVISEQRMYHHASHA